MITITPVARALVPADSDAADAFAAPNYDEFQSDREVQTLLQRRPDCLLNVTMAHCDAASPEAIGEADSDEALERALHNFTRLRLDSRTVELHDVLWVYEISRGPHLRQIGLGGMARVDEIRTPERQDAPIIRNEGIREPKARGRARLIEKIGAIVDAVNNAVDDEGGELERALDEFAAAHPPSYETRDASRHVHRIWLVHPQEAVERFCGLMAAEPQAYVADGNHRSAAAAMLGREHFIAVFFPARSMHIAPYNRLLSNEVRRIDITELEASFEVDRLEGHAFQPANTHDIGFYDGDAWWRLRPRPGTFDAADAAQDIDADIVQRRLFADVFGITDPRDARLTFVGGDRDAAWLQGRVDAGDYAYAVTLPAVTMDQFIRVCRQGRMMPPKSTWFEPKILSGLVMALLD